MTAQTSLSLLLKRYRMAAGLSQEALAHRADLSARAISDLERGLHRAPHTATLDLLATALALSSQQRALLLAAARPELAAEAQDQGVGGSVVRPLGLPMPPTTLIGREREYAEALVLLRRDSVRLITLTGPSGVGKTRLALQIAHDIAAAFRDGAIFVDLAPVRDAALVPSAVAQTMHLREQGNMSLDQQVRSYLYEKNMLLLLDNFEQVIESALFVADLLAWCPHISVLITSRMPLHLRGEHMLQLAPLSLEDAIVLLRERAHAARPGSAFAVSEAAAICERLDRLPLAIELVAAQLTVLSLPQVLIHLNQHMALVLGTARDLPNRQRTMAAAIGWSYDLLTPSQQLCFHALSVFVGGMTLAAARAVCWGNEPMTEAEALLTLAALVDAGLVQVDIVPSGFTRFHLLELVREYALERLRTEGEEEACRRRHAIYYAALAATMVLAGGSAQELPNARAALEWAEAQHEAELGLRLAGFARLWDMRGAAGEAEHWLEKTLALDAEARDAGNPCAPPSLRVERLYGYARALLNHGKLEQAGVFARESVALAQDINDPRGLSDAYATLGMIAQAKGDIEQATAAFIESVTHASPDARSESRYHTQYYMAELARYQGDFSQAHTLLEGALEDAQAAANGWDCAIMLTLLGHLERQQHDNARARGHYLEGLARFHAFDSPTYFAWCLEGYSALLCAEGSHARATHLCAAAATLRLQSHTPLPAAERGEFERILAAAREAMGETAFDAEWAIGSSFTAATALAEATMPA